MSIKIKKCIQGVAIAVLPLLFTACAKQDKISNTNQLTVGKIQYNISKEMSSADVIKALGSPNIITKEKNGNMTWVYDKIKTYKATTSQGPLDFVRLNNNDFVITGGIAAAGAAMATTGSTTLLSTIASIGALTFLSSNTNETIETQQKTLTVILDFDENEKLKDFSYMYSSF